MIECIDVTDDKRLKEPSIVAYLAFAILSTITFATFSLKDEPLLLIGLIALEFLGCIFFFRMTGRYSMLLWRDLKREAILSPNHDLVRYVPLEDVENIRMLYEEYDEDYDAL